MQMIVQEVGNRKDNMDELKEIKKIYGEDMMHLCRELFPSLLEKRGLLLSILKKKIAPTHFLGTEIIDNNLQESFKDYIYGFIKEHKENRTITDKTPFELMDEAGYTLYECKTEEDIQSFKKYYKKDEVLCTIYMGGRLERCHVFFAVKKNVDEIKREDFNKPKREDEYGTSVISIQFSKGKNNTISIKNRYNHTVNNPDSTFGNNLENIIPGLTYSFEKYYHFNVRRNLNEEISNVIEEAGPYLLANDGKWYRCFKEINGIYYCENNIIIVGDQIIKDYANYPERYILADNYIVDMKEKKIFLHEVNPDPLRKCAFVDSINDVGKIERIYVTKNDDGKTINIVYEDKKEIKIKINKNNNIVGYYNDYVEKISNFFLELADDVKELSLLRVQEIGDDFLYFNKRLRSISLPNVKKIGEDFMSLNISLREINLPKVEEIGNGFLYDSEVEKISLPNVKVIGHNFMRYNFKIKEISLPNVQKVGSYFLAKNENNLSNISMPNVKIIDGYFLRYNNILKEITLPSVEKVGPGFMLSNNSLERISLPNVEEIGPGFLDCNRSLKSFFAPKLKKFDCKNITNIQDLGRFGSIINNEDDNIRSR